MPSESIFKSLKAKFPQSTIYQHHPLAPYTTLNIGGPADIFIHTKNNHEFIDVLQFLSLNNGADNIFFERSECEERRDEPAGSEAQNKMLSSQLITILGNGSNVLISDYGIRGIVIKNSSQEIKIIDTDPIKIDFRHSYTQRKENEPDKYLDFTKLDYDESDKSQVLAELSSGTPLPYAINYLISQGVTGLQWFAYIPGTIGGATWYNIHGGSYHFADYIANVSYFNLKTGKIMNLNKSEPNNFSYESSPFQQHPEWIILSTTLRLFKGDATLAAKVKDAWITQKSKVQPMNSAGSVFANPSLSDCQKIWGEQKSTGWIIDHELGWKGKTVGGAQISLQHANFIVNTGTATASDYYQLLIQIQTEVQSRFGLHLVPEVKLLGQF